MVVTLASFFFHSDNSDSELFLLVQMTHRKTKDIFMTQAYTHQQVCSTLKQIVGVEDFLIMPSQVWADSFAGAKAHLYGNLGPVPVSADNIESTCISYQLKQQGKTSNQIIYFFQTRNSDAKQLLTLFNLYKSKILRSTCGIFSGHPCKSQNFAIWSKKLSLTRVWA